MNKYFFVLALASLTTGVAHGQVIPAAGQPTPVQPAPKTVSLAPPGTGTAPAASPNRSQGVGMTTDQAADAYFTNPNPTLTPQEKAGIEIGRRWQQDAALGMKPVAGSDGSIRYLYGASEPTIVCAVLQVCDVALQAGEQVNSINLGDTARWTVDPAITGSGPEEVQHLIIKPMDVGLTTSLIVTTDRRTYHFRLLSHRTEYMPFVSFSYPEDAMAKWETLRKEEAKERVNNTMPGNSAAPTSGYLPNLRFDYKIEGNAAWTPVRVYNDGVKTIIQMPHTIEQNDAPTLLVIRKVNGSYKDGNQEMVNYRFQADKYIVDNVFDRAVLISGVGRDQARVTITREN